MNCFLSGYAHEAAFTDEPCRDENAKEMLKDIQIFSLVLKSAFPEYHSFSIPEIAGRIQYFKGLRPDPEDPESFLDQTLDLSNPETITPDRRKTIYDNLVVIQDMITETLYFVIVEVNTSTPPPDNLVGRDLTYIARAISRQRADPFGMKKDYSGLKPVKCLWILPLSSRVGVLKKHFETEYAGEKDAYIRSVMSASRKMVDSRIVFLNDGWQNSVDETVQALGHLFDTDRKKAIRYMEKEGVKMTRTIEIATEDYYTRHFRTLGRKEQKEIERQLADLNRQIAEKDRQLADRDKSIADRDKSIADRDRAFAKAIEDKDKYIELLEAQLKAVKE